MLGCLGKFYVIAPFQDILIGLSQKHDHDLAQHKYKCDCAVDLITVRVFHPLSY